tara:strand:- start:1282 stop:1482 length:201 start_codon:yes stop_codon:yes gene_type:complete
MPDPERYGLNVVASQIDDQLTQEAFRDQERVNGELRSQIITMTSEIKKLRSMIQASAEVGTILMDE